MKWTGILAAVLASLTLGCGAMAQNEEQAQRDTGAAGSVEANRGDALFEDEIGPYPGNEGAGLFEDDAGMSRGEGTMGEGGNYTRDEYGLYDQNFEWDAADDNFDDWYGDADDDWWDFGV